MSEWENVKEKEKNARVVIHRPAAPLPFPGFFFEGAAIFTSAAENVGNLWNEACKHGLKAERCTHTHRYTCRQQRGHGGRSTQHCSDRLTRKARRYVTSSTQLWRPLPVPVLPLAGLFVVGTGVLAARAEYVHDFRYETGEHRLWRSFTTQP